jgi:hypothetical protein
LYQRRCGDARTAATMSNVMAGTSGESRPTSDRGE